MTTEENKRMEALAYIIADLKTENIEMTQRVHQLMDDYNDVVRQLNETEKQHDEKTPKQDAKVRFIDAEENVRIE